MGSRKPKKIEDVQIYVQQECIDIYNPFPVTVIDVGMSWQGLKCIEYNAFNGSGWYDCDYEKIVQSVTDWVIDNA